jgi:hypothetical protein
MTNWLARLALAVMLILSADRALAQKQSGSKGEDLEKGLPADARRLNQRSADATLTMAYPRYAEHAAGFPEGGVGESF